MTEAQGFWVDLEKFDQPDEEARKRARDEWWPAMLAKWKQGRKQDEIVRAMEAAVYNYRFFKLEPLLSLERDPEQKWPLVIAAFGEDSLVFRFRQGRLDLAIKLYYGAGVPAELAGRLIEETYAANPPPVTSSLRGELQDAGERKRLAVLLDGGGNSKLVLNQAMAAMIGREALGMFGGVVVVPTGILTFEGAPVGMAMRYEKELKPLNYQNAVTNYPELLLMKKRLEECGVEYDMGGGNTLGETGGWFIDGSARDVNCKLLDLRVKGI